MVLRFMRQMEEDVCISISLLSPRRERGSRRADPNFARLKRDQPHPFNLSATLKRSSFLTASGQKYSDLYDVPQRNIVDGILKGNWIVPPVRWNKVPIHWWSVLLHPLSMTCCSVVSKPRSKLLSSYPSDHPQVTITWALGLTTAYGCRWNISFSGERCLSKTTQQNIDQGE